MPPAGHGSRRAMATESCPVCLTDVPLADDAATFVSCSECGTPFVPASAVAVPMVTREAGGLPEGEIVLTDEFRARYKLGRLLGRGAVGMVCEAVHLHSRRVVAAKFLKRLGDAALTERFCQEGRLLARVHHENVLKVFDLGEVGGHPYLITERVGGGTLRERLLRERKLEPAAAVRLAIECLEGLAACHAAGFVHRDIKPENILLTEDGVPRIADLGIARSLESTGGLTRPGTVVGTPRYMSPEQARGEKCGVATDVYAMGIVLYEMILGRPPFDHSDFVEIMRMQVQDAPEPLDEVLLELPAGLAPLLMQALSKAAEARPASAQELADALGRIVQPRVRDVTSVPAPLAEPDAEAPEPAAPAVPRLRQEAERSSGRVREEPEGDPGRGLLDAEPRKRGRSRRGRSPAAEIASELAPAEPSLKLGALAGLFVVGLGLAAIAARYRPASVPVPVPSAGDASPAPAGAAGEAVEERVRTLMRRRQAMERRIAALRNALEDGRWSEMLPELAIATREAEEDVRLTRNLVSELEEAGAFRGAPGWTATRALALSWVAQARRCWMRQKQTQEKGEKESEWGPLLVSGAEAANASLVPPLKRWLGAAESQLKRPASMPSTAGPELAEILADVHAVSTAVHILEWNPATQPLVDHAGKTFLANLERMPGMTAGLISRIASDLWKWGHAEGATSPSTSGVMFDDNRAKTVEHIKTLSSFLSPPARVAMQDLMERARMGFPPH